MVKRTKKMADRVREALTKIESDFLLCRNRRRHDYAKPELKIPVEPGKHSAILNFVCQECGTVRKDVWKADISREYILSLPEQTFVSRTYTYPDGYSLDGDLEISSWEFQEEFMNRMFREMVKDNN